MAVRARVDLKRGWDHLKTIASTLENLRGTLAFELIQNADDAKARRLTFTFGADALTVSDTGGFRRCDALDEHDCPLEQQNGRRRPCDFHALRRLGGATKAADPESTGAFGIGFLAVYQVTDRPEVLSAGVHWEIDDENERVRVCDGGCGRAHITAGTEIVLPWASRKTRMRHILDAPVFKAADRRRLHRDFVVAIPDAMIFLRHLQRIDVVGEDGTTATFKRRERDGRVTVSGLDGSIVWRLLTTSFDGQIAPLRDRTERLRERRADVRVALRDGGNVDGRLYATLPTQVETRLPFHIDATFFPRMDRKGVLLDGDYAEEWNCAAVAAAGRALAADIEHVATILTPGPFWECLHTCARLARGQDREHKALESLWHSLLPVLPGSRVMWTSAGAWEIVSHTVMPPLRGPVGQILEEALGIPTVARDIRARVPRQLNVPKITLEVLVDALGRLPLTDGTPVKEAPPLLAEERTRDALRDLLEELLPADVDDELDEALANDIRALSMWTDSTGQLTSFEASYVGERDTVAAFHTIAGYPLVAWPPTKIKPRSDRLWRLADRFEMQRAVTSIRGAELDNAQAVRVLRWFQKRIDDLTDEQLEEVAAAALIPTAKGPQPASKAVRPGGFKDILQITSVVDEVAARPVERFLRRLEIKPLAFADYLRVQLPAAMRTAGVPNSRVVDLIRECGKHGDVLDDNELRTSLQGLAWIPCRDGGRRRPDDAYFDTRTVRAVLGNDRKVIDRRLKRDSSAGAVLQRLGVAPEPRLADVVARVRNLSDDDRTKTSVAASRAVLEFLADHVHEVEAGDLSDLRTIAWLPAERHPGWLPPGELQLSAEKRLFTTSGTFIALKSTDQARLREVLLALGVQPGPTVALVARHVANIVNEGRRPIAQILLWLNARAGDADIQMLRSVEFLHDRDGAPRAPDDVFTELHPLVPRLAVLAVALRRYGALLADLDVPARPSGDDALGLLEDLARETSSGEPADAETTRLVTGCWQILNRDATVDLGILEELAVVLANDGCLYRPADVVLEDTNARTVLGAEASDRLVRLTPTTAEALERAGVGRLSRRLRAKVQGRRGALRDATAEARLTERQPHLARVVGAEGGTWEAVLAFAAKVKVKTIDPLRLRYSIVGIDGLPDSPLVEQDAFYDADAGELFVAAQTTARRWASIADAVKEALLPGSGPSAKLTLREVLQAPGPDDATLQLDDLGYPPLDEETWEEFRRVARERAVSEAADANADVEDDADTDAEDLADDDVDDGEDGEDGEDEDDDQHEDDEAGGGQTGGSSADGHGARQARGAGNGRAGGGGRGHDGGHSGSGGNGRGREGRKGGRGGAGGAGGRRNPDRRLISYVSTATDDAAASGDGTGARRDAVGDAGVDLVVKHLVEELADAGLTVRKMPDGQKGYDVLVCDANENPVRYVEVKTLTDRWGDQGVGLSRAQFEHGLEMRERFWLFVVEHLYDPEARIWAIKDPAGQVGQFFFDRGWKAVADSEAWVTGATPPQPA